MTSGWTPQEENRIAAIQRAENATRMEAIRAMRRRTTAGIYRAPAQPAPARPFPGKLFAQTA